MSKNETEVINRLVTDLVKLSIKTHNILIHAQIPAAYAAEAHEVLLACESICKEFTHNDTQTTKED
jgi:hypothetical protein